MRMWMIDPKLLCRAHLLGEHGEIHKFRHNFVKGHRIDGRKGQILPLKMQERHDELVVEMLRRGYNHKSPYVQPDLSSYGNLTGWEVDVIRSVNDLCSRCSECRKRIQKRS